ncbi:MAG: NTP transferase domain-containing protein [Acidimicrobiia bacterium]|nr:NTP transferase domain-containing protein [Acidimicrobiia bacterium]
MEIDVAVIPAAGRGTRMRPATRALPKAMLPIVDRPAVQWVVEEAVRAGAREVFVIVDPGVGVLIDRHFNSQEEGPLPGLEDVVVHPIVQDVPRGLGDAVRTAADAVGHRPFFTLLVDNLVYPDGDVLGHMADAADAGSVVCLRELGTEYLARYGFIVPGEWRTDRVVEVHGAIEKPGVEAAPSKLGLIGRYLFSSAIFEALDHIEPGVGGELQLTDAINAVGEAGSCLGYVSEDDLLDSGTPSGYLESSTVLGAAHPDFGARYRAFVTEFTEGL